MCVRHEGRGQMFRSVVVPLDGSALADRAIPYAALLATPAARVALVAVVEPVPNVPVLARGELDEEEARMRTLLGEDLHAKAVALAAKGFAVTSEVRLGDPAEQIICRAGVYHADLIALTTHGRMGMSRWLLGSVATRVLQGASVATLIIRPDMHRSAEAPPAIASLIVLLDGSALAAEAIPVARELARQLHVPVECVRVVDDRDKGLFYGPYSQMYAHDLWEKTRAKLCEEADRYLRDIAERLRATGLAASGTVLSGLAAEELTQYLADRPHALAIMTTHGRSGVSRWMLGSVAEKLATSATVPILVLRSTAVAGNTADHAVQAQAVPIA